MKTLATIVVVLLVLTAIGYVLIYTSLPDEEEIASYRPATTINAAEVLNWDARHGKPWRHYVPLSRISNHLRVAVIISEDDTFYRHDGINYDQMKLVAEESIKEKRVIRGAGTITMQLARNAFLTRERTFIRKLKEILLAKRIEKVLSKSRILELYLNVVEWGPNIFGAEAASWYYFNKPAQDLDQAEASILASILINPIRFNLFNRFSSAKKLQMRILRLMRDARIITQEEMDALFVQPVVLRGRQNE